MIDFIFDCFRKQQAKSLLKRKLATVEKLSQELFVQNENFKKNNNGEGVVLVSWPLGEDRRYTIEVSVNGDKDMLKTVENYLPSRVDGFDIEVVYGEPFMIY